MADRQGITILAEKDLPDLCDILKNATSQWKTIGDSLGFLDGELEVITSIYPLSPAGAFRELLRRWLKWAPPNHDLATLEQLALALRRAGEERLAHDLPQQFQKKEQTDSGNQPSRAPKRRRTSAEQTSEMQPVLREGSAEQLACDLPQEFKKRKEDNEDALKPSSSACENPSEVPNTAGDSDSMGSHSLRVQEEIKTLEESFWQLRYDTERIVENASVDVKAFVVTITLLPVTLRDEHLLFIKENKDQLISCNSHESAFACLDTYWDFLNYTLLKRITDKFGDQEIKQRMEMYEKKVKEFRQHTPLRLFCKAQPFRHRKVPENFKELITKHANDWSNFTLEKVENFRQQFAYEYGLREIAMMIRIIEPGSTIITWLIPESITNDLAERILGSEKRVLRDHEVLQVVIDGVCVYDSTSMVPEEPHSSIAAETPKLILALEDPLTSSDTYSGITAEVNPSMNEERLHYRPNIPPVQQALEEPQYVAGIYPQRSQDSAPQLPHTEASTEPTWKAKRRSLWKDFKAKFAVALQERCRCMPLFFSGVKKILKPRREDTIPGEQEHSGSTQMQGTVIEMTQLQELSSHDEASCETTSDNHQKRADSGQSDDDDMLLPHHRVRYGRRLGPQNCFERYCCLIISFAGIVVLVLMVMMLLILASVGPIFQCIIGHEGSGTLEVFSIFNSVYLLILLILLCSFCCVYIRAFEPTQYCVFCSVSLIMLIMLVLGTVLFGCYLAELVFSSYDEFKANPHLCDPVLYYFSFILVILDFIIVVIVIVIPVCLLLCSCCTCDESDD